MRDTLYCICKLIFDLNWQLTDIKKISFERHVSLSKIILNFPILRKRDIHKKVKVTGIESGHGSERPSKERFSAVSLDRKGRIMEGNVSSGKQRSVEGGAHHVLESISEAVQHVPAESKVGIVAQGGDQPTEGGSIVDSRMKQKSTKGPATGHLHSAGQRTYGLLMTLAPSPSLPVVAPVPMTSSVPSDLPGTSESSARPSMAEPNEPVHEKQSMETDQNAEKSEEMAGEDTSEMQGDGGHLAISRSAPRGDDVDENNKRKRTSVKGCMLGAVVSHGGPLSGIEIMTKFGATRSIAYKIMRMASKYPIAGRLVYEMPKVRNGKEVLTTISWLAEHLIGFPHMDIVDAFEANGRADVLGSACTKGRVAEAKERSNRAHTMWIKYLDHFDGREPINTLLCVIHSPLSLSTFMSAVDGDEDDRLAHVLVMRVGGVFLVIVTDSRVCNRFPMDWFMHIGDHTSAFMWLNLKDVCWTRLEELSSSHVTLPDAKKAKPAPLSKVSDVTCCGVHMLAVIYNRAKLLPSHYIYVQPPSKVVKSSGVAVKKVPSEWCGDIQKFAAKFAVHNRRQIAAATKEAAAREIALEIESSERLAAEALAATQRAAKQAADIAEASAASAALALSTAVAEAVATAVAETAANMEAKPILATISTQTPSLPSPIHVETQCDFQQAVQSEPAPSSCLETENSRTDDFFSHEFFQNGANLQSSQIEDSLRLEEDSITLDDALISDDKQVIAAPPSLATSPEQVARLKLAQMKKLHRQQVYRRDDSEWYEMEEMVVSGYSSHWELVSET